MRDCYISNRQKNLGNGNWKKRMNPRILTFQSNSCHCVRPPVSLEMNENLPRKPDRFDFSNSFAMRNENLHQRRSSLNNREVNQMHYNINDRKHCRKQRETRKSSEIKNLDPPHSELEREKIANFSVKRWNSHARNFLRKRRTRCFFEKESFK